MEKDKKEAKKLAIEQYSENAKHQLKSGIAKLKASKLLLQHENGYALTLSIEEVGSVLLRFSKESKEEFISLIDKEIKRFEDVYSGIDKETKRKLEKI